MYSNYDETTQYNQENTWNNPCPLPVMSWAPPLIWLDFDLWNFKALQGPANQKEEGQVTNRDYRVEVISC